MLIMCAASLIVIGYINMSTSKQGRMLTQKNVNYADFIMAKNTAQTAIQMAMQQINSDEDWADNHDKSQGNPPWTPTVEGRKVSLYTIYKEHPQFFEADTLRLVANAEYKNITVEVNSLYWMEPFSTLVPEFQGALQLPTDIGTFGVDGTAHNINGTPPAGSGCTDSKPPVTANSDETRQKVESVGTNVDGDIVVDPSLNYEPTDELIERLYNSGNAITVDGNYSSQLGTADNPGVFFVDGSVKLTGQQSEGYGILVVRSGGNMEYGEDGELSVAGNFEFNGLVIFENAFNFDGRGTPTINGSVLIGNTSDYSGDPINISLGGNININYDCRGEEYAKRSAAMAVKQNRYSRVTTTEGVNFSQ
jgi:hypothetical protein